MKIEEKDKLLKLYDLYANMLTKLQQEVFTLYYGNDLSLMEIAEIKNVSRNAVFSLIHRVEKQLYEFEEKLHLFLKFYTILDVLNENKVSEEVTNKIEEIMEG